MELSKLFNPGDGRALFGRPDADTMREVRRKMDEYHKREGEGEGAEA